MRLNNYMSKEPKSRLLGEGVHRVSLLSYIEVDSMTSIKDGKLAGKKDKIFPWVNPVDQLYIVVGNKDGVVGYRHNLSGFPRYTELSDKQLASGRFVDKQGFACEITENGLVRAEDPDRTAKCESILDSILWACGAIPGMPALDVLDSALANKTEFLVTVVRDAWKETEDSVETSQLRLTKFQRIEVPVTGHADIA